MPGVMTCPGLGDGDAVGICIPGVIMCGVGEGEGLGLVGLFLGVRLVRVAVLFFAAAFGFGFAAGLGMVCPSCCGNALVVSVNTKASALSGRSAILKLLDKFMVASTWFAKANF
jgi:hypothetical protein